MVALAPPGRRLVAVSNRTATPGEVRAGGLAVALGDALGERGGLWFGWSGTLSDGPARPLRLLRDGGVDFALTDLSPAEHDGYYLGYANRVLWPVLHARVDLAECDGEAFAAYERVNRRFARELAPLLRADDIVWVHDYHLMLLGRELRRNGWRGTVGFFLHTPFPAPEIFAALPQHARLADALCEVDLLGFQTRRDAGNFRRYMAAFHGAHPCEGGLVLGRRTPRVGSFPIGTDPREVAALATGPAGRAAAARLARALGDRALVIGADRMDYSKGVPHRLRGFGRLLREHPEVRGRVSMLQIASPSRTAVGAYRDLAAEVERTVGRINGVFGGIDWTPVRYIGRCCPRAALCGLFRAARVGLVTPLRDGMNLVAKEYVAAQDPDDPGVLVLSRFAGAAAQLDAALLVNPHDGADVARAIRRALAMRLAERRDRWRALADNVWHEDIAWWRRRFIGALEAARGAAAPAESAPAEPLAAAF